MLPHLFAIMLFLSLASATRLFPPIDDLVVLRDLTVLSSKLYRKAFEVYNLTREGYLNEPHWSGMQSTLLAYNRMENYAEFSGFLQSRIKVLELLPVDDHKLQAAEKSFAHLAHAEGFVLFALETLSPALNDKVALRIDGLLAEESLVQVVNVFHAHQASVVRFNLGLPVSVQRLGLMARHALMLTEQMIPVKLVAGTDQSDTLFFERTTHLDRVLHRLRQSAFEKFATPLDSQIFLMVPMHGILVNADEFSRASLLGSCYLIYHSKCDGCLYFFITQ